MRTTLLATRIGLGLAVLSAGGCAHSTGGVEQSLTPILDSQAQAWNRGDLDAFMRHYWRSERLTFSAGGDTQRGFDATLARYRTRYPTPERMGRLTFSELEFRRLCRDAALVLGRWSLERGAERLGGNFSLVFERIDGRWVIVHDHTSSSPPAERRPSN